MEFNFGLEMPFYTFLKKFKRAHLISMHLISATIFVCEHIIYDAHDRRITTIKI
jgi:hypothetical protein